MALSAAPFVPKDGALVFADGAALTYTVVYEDGDFAWGPVPKGFKSVVDFFQRGRYYASRETDDIVLEFSFSCHAIGVTGDGSTATIFDVIYKHAGSLWASATSMLPAAAGDAYHLKLTWTGERSNIGATTDSTIVMKYCQLEISFAEGIPGKWSIKGKLKPYSTDYLTIT